MSARSSVTPRNIQWVSRWLSLGLLCMSMIGCKTWAPCAARTPATTPREMPIRFVSETTSTASAKRPEAWQLQKTQREAAVKKAVVESKQPTVESKFEAAVTPASFEKRLWQSDEPTPVMASENSWNSECASSGDDAEFECPQICFGCDLDNALSTLCCDAKGVVNWNNGLILAAAGGAAIWMHVGSPDREVREGVASHPNRWGETSQTLGRIGQVEYQAPVLLGLYGYSVWKQDEELHDVMGSLLSATTITGISTSALKLVTDTARPSTHWMNGHYGFPSYHTASTFAIAAVLDEYYGCKVGLPAYLLAGAVGFSRLDEQDHDLSDVFFGGALGFVIGKAVAGRHLCGNSKIQFGPYFHPTDGSPGVTLETKF